MRTGILGGGLSGLTIGHFLKEKPTILEKENEIGGLCRTFKQDGFTFDIGGHILFSRNKEILKEMVGLLGGNVEQLYRNNRVYFKGRFVKYPFENDLAALPKEDAFECLYHYIVNDYPQPTNFKEWLYRTFGKGIAEKYLIPYNEKIWNTKAENMSIEWCEGRIPKPPVEDVIKSALGIRTEGYVHQLYFYYPKSGGIRSLVDAIAADAGEIKTSFCVKKIQKTNGNFVVSDGAATHEFDRLISTIPLPELIPALEGAPADVARAAAELAFNSVIIVLIGTARKNLSDKFAVYFPQDYLPFHRVCFLEYLGARYRAGGNIGLIAEITSNKGDGFWEKSDGEIVAEVIKGLERERFISASDVSLTDVKRIKYGYVVYDLKHTEKTQKVRNFVEDFGITLCGRFAENEYLNMDACFERAKNTAARFNKLET